MADSENNNSVDQQVEQDVDKVEQNVGAEAQKEENAVENDVPAIAKPEVDAAAADADKVAGHAVSVANEDVETFLEKVNDAVSHYEDNMKAIAGQDLNQAHRLLVEAASYIKRELEKQ